MFSNAPFASAVFHELLNAEKAPRSLSELIVRLAPDDRILVTDTLAELVSVGLVRCCCGSYTLTLAGEAASQVLQG